MNLLAIVPPFTVFSSVILNWLLTFLLVAAVVLFIIWLLKKLVGPVVFPEWFALFVWGIATIGIVFFILSVFGIRIP